MSFITNNTQRLMSTLKATKPSSTKDSAKLADVDLEHAANNQLDGLMPPRVFSDGAALAATASVYPNRLPSIQARRARRPSPLTLSMVGNSSHSMTRNSSLSQRTVVGDPITHRVRSQPSSAALPTTPTPKAAIITTIPVTTTEAPANGGVLFVPPTRSSGTIRRRANVKTRRPAKGNKSTESPPLLSAAFMSKSSSRNVNMPPIRMTNSKGEMDMAYYRTCALKLAGLPVDRSPSVESQKAEIFGL